MKPAPFEKTRLAPINRTPYVIIADPGAKETQILDSATKSLMWKMSTFIGRKAAYVSADGQTLIVFGNEYFGGMISTSSDAPIVIVYEKGIEKKQFLFSQVYGKTASAAAAEKKIPEMSGGWVNLEKLIAKMDVDWSQKNLLFTLGDGSKKIISYK